MDLRLYVMAEAGGLNGDFCEQAGEVVETSYNLWRSNLKKGSSDDLVRMILNEQNPGHLSDRRQSAHRSA